MLKFYQSSLRININALCVLMWIGIIGSASAARLYKLYRTPLRTWNEAKDFCANEGGMLAKITSSADNDRAWNAAKVYFAGNGRRWFGPWIGVNDISKEGNWKNVDGSNVPYTSWDIGQPDNAGNEDCVHYFNFAKKWNDNPCSAKLSTLCSFDVAPCKTKPFNKPCQFPFQHDGKTYNVCAEADFEHGKEQPWCQVIGGWDYCNMDNPRCKTDGGVANLEGTSTSANNVHVTTATGSSYFDNNIGMSGGVLLLLIGSTGIVGVAIKIFHKTSTTNLNDINDCDYERLEIEQN